MHDRGARRLDVIVEIPASLSGIERVAEVPIYAADSLVRHAASLQQTADARNARKISLASDVAATLGITNGMDVRITQDGNSVILAAPSI